MRQVAKKKKWISDETFVAIREKRAAKGKDKNPYQELKAEAQRMLRVDKQQQLEGTGSSELKRKFQAALPDSQIHDSKVPLTFAMYLVSDCENLTETAQMELLLFHMQKRYFFGSYRKGSE